MVSFNTFEIPKIITKHNIKQWMGKKFLKHHVLGIGVKFFDLLNYKQNNLLGHIYSDFLELGLVTKKSFGGRNLYRI
jgi:hypothetical protein